MKQFLKLRETPIFVSASCGVQFAEWKEGESTSRFRSATADIGVVDEYETKN